MAERRPDGKDKRPLDAFRQLWKPSDEWFIEDITTQQRAVLTVLVVHANGDGLAWPSHPTIAKASGLGRSTVVRVLGELETLGIITRTSNPPKSTRYTVLLRDRPALGPSRSGTVTVSLREFDSPAAGHELLKELPKELDTSKSVPLIIDNMWKIWLEELGGKPPCPKLTDKRREKLEALYYEHLEQKADPSTCFRAICRAVLASEHHMSDRTYQMPESLFVNEERRERWYLKSLKGTRNVQTRERKDGKWAPAMTRDLQAMARRDAEEEARQRMKEEPTTDPSPTTTRNEEEPEESAESVTERMKNL